jgi:catechol 2,3-dioxygenase-like lactoylglutathione lyase family enzyme
MQIEFVSSFAVITTDPGTSRRLYVDTLGLPLAGQGDDGYIHSEQIPGTRHFGVWPLTEAAQACFERPEWPDHLGVPQASVEFDVADVPAVQAAADELTGAGYDLLHPVREEPWGQTVVRLLSPEGVIVGISYAPALH